MLIDQIIKEFQIVVMTIGDNPLNQQERLCSLLEVTIDGQFRELINSAVNRQSSVVAYLNVQIITLNIAVICFTVGVGVLSLSIIFYGCYWLFTKLYQPITLIRNAINAIASRQFDSPFSEILDGEFEELSSSTNQLAKRLKEHESTEKNPERN